MNSSNRVSVKKSRFMLVSKILLIVNIIVLYVMQVMIVIPVYGMINEVETFTPDLIVLGVLIVAPVVLGLVAFILAIIGGVKNEAPATLITVIVKIVMIPFFIANFVCWLLCICGMMNPFLIWGTPIVGVVGMLITYIYMMVTSWPDIIYTFIFCKKNKRKLKGMMRAGVILEFFFVLDVIGSILLHKALDDNTRFN